MRSTVYFQCIHGALSPIMRPSVIVQSCKCQNGMALTQSLISAGMLAM